MEPTAPHFDLYEDFTEKAKAIFEPETVEILFRIKRMHDNKDEIVASGTMYFSRGDFHLRHDGVPELEQDVQMRNYATIDGKLYQWYSGAKEGEILRRFPGDTVELIDYLVDPAMIMRYTYLDYWKSPNDFNMTEEGEQQALMRKEPPYGFLGIRIIPKPLWFCANLFDNPMKRKTDRIVFEVDPPKSVPHVPERFRTLPKGVSFKQSEDTVDSVLTYL